MAKLFIHPVEHRLRAFWRLIFQGGLYLIFLLLLEILFGTALGMMAVQAGIPLSDALAIQNYAANIPWLMPASSVISLAAILMSYWVARKMDKRPFADFGFHFSNRWWRDFGFGLLLGAVLMVFIFGVELAAGWIRITGTLDNQGGGSFASGILAAMVSFICVGISEEMLSRGYQLHNLAEGIHGRWLNPKMALLVSYLLTSSLFGFMHAFNPNATLLSSLFLVIAGLFLGLGYILTGELAIPIGLHMTWNFFQGNVFGFPVSGTNAGARWIAIEQTGPDLWTGGAFGPESGLIGLTAFLLGSILILWWVKSTRSSIRLAEELAVYSIPVAEAPSEDQG